MSGMLQLFWGKFRPVRALDFLCLDLQPVVGAAEGGRETHNIWRDTILRGMNVPAAEIDRSSTTIDWLIFMTTVSFSLFTIKRCQYIKEAMACSPQDIRTSRRKLADTFLASYTTVLATGWSLFGDWYDNNDWFYYPYTQTIALKKRRHTPHLAKPTAVWKRKKRAKPPPSGWWCLGGRYDNEWLHYYVVTNGIWTGRFSFWYRKDGKIRSMKAETRQIESNQGISNGTMLLLRCFVLALRPSSWLVCVAVPSLTPLPGRWSTEKQNELSIRAKNAGMNDKSGNEVRGLLPNSGNAPFPFDVINGIILFPSLWTIWGVSICNHE